MTPHRRYAEAQVKALRLQLCAAEQALLDIIEAEQDAQETADEWVYLPALCRRLGLSEHAARSRVARKTFTEGIHWRREKAGKRTRQIFNVRAIQQLLSGK